MPQGGGWDETDSSYRYRVREPGSFDSIRTKQIAEGVAITGGSLDGSDSWSTQAVILSKDRFDSLQEARDWLSDHEDLMEANRVITTEPLMESDPQVIREAVGVNTDGYSADESVVRDCVLIEAGLNQTGSRYYEPGFLQEHLGRFEGAFGFVDHPTATEAKQKPERSMDTIAVTIENARWSEAQDAVLGDVHFLDTDSGRNMRAAFENPIVRERAGLSIYWPYGVEAENRRMNESDVMVPQKLLGSENERFDIDVVTRPTAGGKITIREGGNEMPELDELTIEQLQEERPDLVKELTADADEDEVTESDTETEETEEEEADEETVEESDVAEKIEKLQAENERLRAQGVVKDTLEEADLGEKARGYVRKQFADVRCAEGHESELRESIGEVIGTVGEMLKEAGVGKPRGITGADTGDSEDFNAMDAIREASGFETADDE
ncbi:MAG: hypothetical protein K9L56_15195 [Clostridiales bacterium]|nr:hypothetical protein [Clostridiales bacterium]